MLAALVFSGVRIFYTLVALTTRDADLNPSTGKLAIRVVLSFLMELISALILVGAGLATRNASQQTTEMPRVDKEMRPLRRK